MDLVERYLQAVRFWLPTQQKHDIIAELSEDIHAQIEEQEATLARMLNESELAALLKQRGNPMLVANRYLPQQSLIGPVLFPVYRFVLKVVTLCYLGPALLWMATVAFGHLYPAGQTRQALLTALSSLWFTAFVSSATITLVFAILERVPRLKSRIFENWNPRKLPALRNFNRITRPAASCELTANLLMTIWWATYMRSPIVWNHPVIHVSQSLWPYFFWGFLFIGIINTALSAANLARPYWSGPRATVRLLSDCAGAALFCWLLDANILTGIAISNISPETAQQITDSVNMWMARALPGAIAVGVVIFTAGVFRLVRVTTTKLRLPWEPAVSST